MFKLAAITVAEELSSHWSDTLALPAFIVALHIEMLFQLAMAGIFLVTWIILKVRVLRKEHEANESTAA